MGVKGRVKEKKRKNVKMCTGKWRRKLIRKKSVGIFAKVRKE